MVNAATVYALHRMPLLQPLLQGIEQGPAKTCLRMQLRLHSAVAHGCVLTAWLPSWSGQKGVPSRTYASSTHMRRHTHASRGGVQPMSQRASAATAAIGPASCAPGGCCGGHRWRGACGGSHERYLTTQDSSRHKEAHTSTCMSSEQRRAARAGSSCGRRGVRPQQRRAACRRASQLYVRVIRTHVAWMLEQPSLHDRVSRRR